MSDVKVAELLNDAGDFASKMAAVIGGKPGAVLLGAASIAKAIAVAIKSRGESVEDILGKIRKPRDVVAPWDGEIPTTPQTPNSKKKGP